MYSEEQKWLLGGGFYGVIGVGLLMMAVYGYRMERQLMEGSTASGTVVALQSDKDGYHAIVRFTDVDGESRTFAEPVDPEEFSKGDSVEVAYLPSRPSTAAIKGGEYWSSLAWKCVLFGSLSSLAGVCIGAVHVWGNRLRAFGRRLRREWRLRR